MKSLLLIGPDKDLTKEEKSILASKDFKGSFTNADLDARHPVSLSLQKDSDNTWIPSLYFPSQDHCTLFFEWVESSVIGRAFSTSPPEHVQHLHGKIFEHPANRFTYAIQMNLLNDPDYGTYTHRMLQFTKVPPHPVRAKADTAIQCSYPAQGEAAFTWLYPLFTDPVEADLPADKQGLLYNTFFKGKKDFPIALPPVTGQGSEESYFQANRKLVRQEMNDLFVAWYEDAGIKTTLGFKVWQALDNPVFRDCLQEGAWFDLTARQDQKGQETAVPFYADGFGAVELVYPLRQQDPLYRWRVGLLTGEEGNTWHIITAAIQADMRAALQLDDMAIRQEEEHAFDPGYWDHLSLPGFKKNARYYNDIIEKFAAYLPQGKQLVQTQVLDLATDGDQYDQKLALQAFCGNYWKYPFRAHPESIAGWTKLLIDLMGNRGQVKADTLYQHLYGEDLALDNAGAYIYTNHYRPEDLLNIRLLLPGKALLQSGSNNILDHVNARLDNHFMLD